MKPQGGRSTRGLRAAFHATADREAAANMNRKSYYNDAACMRGTKRREYEGMVSKPTGSSDLTWESSHIMRRHQRKRKKREDEIKNNRTKSYLFPNLFELNGGNVARCPGPNPMLVEFAVMEGEDRFDEVPFWRVRRYPQATVRRCG